MEKAGIVRKKSSSKDLGIAGVTVGVLSAQSFTQPFLEDFAGLSPTTYDDEVGCLVALSICKFCCPVCDVHVPIHQGDLQDALADGTIDLVFTTQTESTDHASDTYDFVIVEKDYVGGGVLRLPSTA